jgi:signal transduction histidine kinase
MNIQGRPPRHRSSAHELPGFPNISAKAAVHKRAVTRCAPTDLWSVVETTAHDRGEAFGPALRSALAALGGVGLVLLFHRVGANGPFTVVQHMQRILLEDTLLSPLLHDGGPDTLSSPAPSEVGPFRTTTEWMIAASARARSSESKVILCMLGSREALESISTEPLKAFAARAVNELEPAPDDLRQDPASVHPPEAHRRTSVHLRYTEALLALAPLRLPTPEAQLRAIVECAGCTLAVERTSYWSLVEDGEAIACEHLYTRSTATFTAGGKLAAGDYPSYFRALRTCQSIDASEAATDPRTVEFATGYFDVHGIKSMLDVPVWQEGRLAGVVCLEDMTGRHWTSEDVAFARSIAQHIATTLESAARDRAEERYRLVSNAIGEVVWDADFPKGKVDWSGAMKAFRYPQDAMGAVDWWVSKIHPDDRARVAESFNAAKKDPSTESWSAEYRFSRGDGTIANVLDRGFFVRDADGHAVRAVGAMVDVTEQRELERRVAISDRMASVGTLAAGVAHEINNPLSYVLGNLELGVTMLEARPFDYPELLESLREAREGAGRVAEIVRSMRSFARTEVVTVGAVVDVDRAVSSALTMAMNEIRHHSRLTKHLGRPPLAQGRETPLVQVVLNLLLNAAQAISEGNVDRDEITIATGVESKGRIFIEISDTGAGMTPETLGRIFDPFFTTKSVGHGLGLGLSIVHSIVMSFGGEITVSSMPGGGSTFRVLLLAASAESVQAHRARFASPIASNRCRVLVVEDEASIAEVLRRFLRSEHDVVLASGGKEALSILTGDPGFDVVLCDVMMPDMTGADLHRVILDRDAELARRFVFISGGVFGEKARTYVDATNQPRVAKPFVRADVLHAIAQVRRASIPGAAESM